jgi:hypothetical protein
MVDALLGIHKRTFTRSLLHCYRVKEQEKQ